MRRSAVGGRLVPTEEGEQSGIRDFQGLAWLRFLVGDADNRPSEPRGHTPTVDERAQTCTVPCLIRHRAASAGTTARRWSRMPEVSPTTPATEVGPATRRAGGRRFVA